MSSSSSHPYEEPSITVILVLVGFILLLNLVHKALDSLLYCGLIGQVLVGVLFGTPGVKLLDNAVEGFVSNLGYLGLILLVYEGGLSTPLSSLISSFVLSLLVALTGIALPIALSFLLGPLGASPLQCFSAGAALSATSLGTAFATLSTSGLLATHLGTVLTSAAMLDDVVGLIMLQVVSELGGGPRTASKYGEVVGRALGASVGLVVVVVAVCRLAVRPLHKLIHTWVYSPKRGNIIKDAWQSPYNSLSVNTLLLVALTVVGSYAGTSILLAAFVAGVTVRWWDDELAETYKGIQAYTTQPGAPAAVSSPKPSITGLEVYERYYAAPAKQILQPFFFASIGFSIPITRMFRAATVWKGFLYALLMFLGKLATGLWLVPSSLVSTTRARILLSFKRVRQQRPTAKSEPKATTPSCPNSAKPAVTNAKVDEAEAENSLPAQPAGPQTPSTSTPASDVPLPAASTQADCEQPISSAPDLSPGEKQGPPSTSTKTPSPSPPAPRQLLGPPESRALRAYAPALVGLAMTARGEIGFLIASVAASNGVFASPSPPALDLSSDDATSELYLVIVWAIVLCTVVGPIAVGGLVRRVKGLERQGKDDDQGARQVSVD